MTRRPASAEWRTGARPTSALLDAFASRAAHSLGAG